MITTKDIEAKVRLINSLLDKQIVYLCYKKNKGYSIRKTHGNDYFIGDREYIRKELYFIATGWCEAYICFLKKFRSYKQTECENNINDLEIELRNAKKESYFTSLRDVSEMINEH